MGEAAVSVVWIRLAGRVGDVLEGLGLHELEEALQAQRVIIGLGAQMGELIAAVSV